MIGRLNHVAIAVPDLEAAADQYRSTLGANVGPVQPEPDHGVSVIGNTVAEAFEERSGGSDAARG